MWGPSTPGGRDTPEHPDLEAVSHKDEPHPLGPKDVIEALTPWTRTIVTSVVVVAVAVGSYLLGTSRERLVILDGPRASTGVLWHCGERLSGVVAVPSGDMSIEVRGGRVRATAARDGLLALTVGHEPLPDHVWVESGSQRIRVPVLSCTPPERDP